MIIVCKFVNTRYNYWLFFCICRLLDTSTLSTSESDVCSAGKVFLVATSIHWQRSIIIDLCYDFPSFTCCFLHHILVIIFRKWLYHSYLIVNLVWVRCLNMLKMKMITQFPASHDEPIWRYLSQKNIIFRGMKPVWSRVYIRMYLTIIDDNE